MILRDPVHGIVAFEREEEAIVVRLLACKEVQRLRRIRQLGLTSFAFPGAEHTRFAHAVGAARVMQMLLEQLRRVDAELPFWQRVTSERARDALAAALLHDLGHGPLSHLFEQALPWPTAATPPPPATDGGATSAPATADGHGAPGDPGHHEWWTERILLDPASDVHRVLATDDPQLPHRVARLIHGEHDLPYLAKAVSGTFDVDRCDYLLRDAHATGVRYGEYDLPWLLRSFRLVGDGDRGPRLCIDGTKGTSAIEAFVLARHFMFQQVYFHKSTRAAEWMIGAILRRAVKLLEDGARLPSTPAALESVAAGDTPTLEQYLDLDDQTLLGALRAWEDVKDPVLSDLCKRLRSRSIFKAVELWPRRPGDARAAAADQAVASGDDTQWALATARGVAEEAGLDPDVYVGLDVATDVPYADDESLSVVFPRGRARRPAEVSFLLQRLRNEAVTRVRIIFAPELRAAMREHLQPT
ncbi:MAG: HD domain-containing protein [Polyangiaceae bacterium]